MTQKTVTQKPNIAFRFALILLSLVMITVALSSGLFAKFVTRDGAADSGRVALFRVGASHLDADLLILENKTYYTSWEIAAGGSLSVPLYPVGVRTLALTLDNGNTPYDGADPDGWTATATPGLYLRSVPRNTALDFTLPAGVSGVCRETAPNARYVLEIKSKSEVSVAYDFIVDFEKDVTDLIDEATILIDGKAPTKKESASGVYTFAYNTTSFANQLFTASPTEYTPAVPDSATDDTNHHVLTFRFREDIEPYTFAYGAGDARFYRTELPADGTDDRTLTVRFADTVYRDLNFSSVADKFNFAPARLENGWDEEPGSYTFRVPQGETFTLAIPENVHYEYTGASSGSGDGAATLSISAKGDYTLKLTHKEPVVYTGSVSAPVTGNGWTLADPAKCEYTFTLYKGETARFNLPRGVVLSDYDETAKTPVEGVVPAEGTVSVPAVGGKSTVTVTCGETDLARPAALAAAAWDDSDKANGVYVISLGANESVTLEGLSRDSEYSYTRTLHSEKNSTFDFTSGRSELSDGLDYDNAVISGVKGLLPFTVRVKLAQVD